MFNVLDGSLNSMCRVANPPAEIWSNPYPWGDIGITVTYLLCTKSHIASDNFSLWNTSETLFCAIIYEARFLLAIGRSDCLYLLPP